MTVPVQQTQQCFGYSHSAMAIAGMEIDLQRRDGDQRWRVPTTKRQSPARWPDRFGTAVAAKATAAVAAVPIPPPTPTTAAVAAAAIAASSAAALQRPWHRVACAAPVAVVLVSFMRYST